MTIHVPSQNMKKSLDLACRKYEDQLPESDASLYLTNRGITNEVQAYFRLGYVKDPFPGHEFQVGRLSIPYITPTGIVQIRFRAVPEGGIPGNPEASPKYKSEASSGTTMFNTRDLLRDDPIVAICEGELDAITSHMAGLPSIGIPGAKNWRSVFARAFRFRRVVILADNDDHGEGLEFAETVQKDLKGSRIILMDSGYDVNRFVVENGTTALRKKIGIKDV